MKILERFKTINRHNLALFKALLSAGLAASVPALIFDPFFFLSAGFRHLSAGFGHLSANFGVLSAGFTGKKGSKSRK